MLQNQILLIDHFHVAPLQHCQLYLGGKIVPDPLLTPHSKLLTYTVRLKYSLRSCEYFSHLPAFAGFPDAVSCF